MNHDEQCLPPTLEVRLNQPRRTSQQAYEQADRFLKAGPKRSLTGRIDVKPSNNGTLNGDKKTAH